jgi:thiamine pyrophosphate-dependent acetolactate synthase large subunit-like protein
MNASIGGDLLVQCLLQEGVRPVFDIPGGQLCPIEGTYSQHSFPEA